MPRLPRKRRLRALGLVRGAALPELAAEVFDVIRKHEARAAHPTNVRVPPAAVPNALENEPALESEPRLVSEVA